MNFYRENLTGREKAVLKHYIKAFQQLGKKIIGVKIFDDYISLEEYCITLSFFDQNELFPFVEFDVVYDNFTYNGIFRDIDYTHVFTLKEIGIEKE